MTKKEAYIAHQNVSHFSEGKHHNKVMDGMTVDIRTNFNWSERLQIQTYLILEKLKMVANMLLHTLVNVTTQAIKRRPQFKT